MSRHLWKLALVVSFLSSVTHAQGWAHTWGGAAADSVGATSRGTNGDLYLAGSTSSFGAGGSDALLLKYDSSGNVLWSRTWGGSSDEHANAVAVDPTGNYVYVTGGTESFGAGWSDVFILKFDTAGNLLWSKTWGGSSYDEGHDIAFDASGNVLIAAEAYSYNPPGTASSSAAILKLSPDGNLLWSRVWGAYATGGPTYNGGYSLDVDSSGNIYESGINWDYRVSPNHNSIFVVKFDSSGNLLWNRNWAGSGQDETGEGWAKAVRVDPNGNVYVAGRTDTQPCSSTLTDCDFDVLLLKLDTSGNFIWARTWKPDTGYDTSTGLAFDTSGNLVLTGAKDEYGPTATALLLRFDPAGNLLTSLDWSGGAGAFGSAVLLDPGGNVFISGNAPSNVGGWQTVTGMSGSENGALTAPSSTVATPTFALGSPSGTITAPAGVVDTGGGGQDAFLSMIPANTFPSSPQPVALPSPSLLSFPNQPVNTTSGAMAISVANTGSATLTITAPPSIGGTEAGDFAIAPGTTCLSGATVATGSSCVIDVTFTPSGTSSESAAISIYDNAANSPQSVALSGTGIVPSSPPPTITSFTPTQGMPGEQIYFQVVGMNFQPGATVSISGGGLDVDPSSIAVSATRISGILAVSSTTALGPYTVTVTDPDMQSASRTGALNVQSIPPTPTNLLATVGNQTVDLQWHSPQAHIQGFNVYVCLPDGTPLGSLVSLPPQTVTFSVHHLPDGSALQNGQIYLFNVTAVGSAGESTPAAVYAEPNVLAAPAHPVYPILFLHGIDSEASTWDKTKDFLMNTLHWKFGGILSYCPTRYSNPSASCVEQDVLGTPQDKDINSAGQVVEPTTPVSAADFFTVDFSDNVAGTSNGIAYQGKEVGGFINFIQSSRVPNTKLSIIAHSMGGLAAEAYITSSPDATEQVADLITAGTPYRGLNGGLWKGLWDLADGTVTTVSSPLALLGITLDNANNFLSAAFPSIPDVPKILASNGFAEMDTGGCYANGDSDNTPNYFVPALNSSVWPSSIRQTAVYGNWVSSPDECNLVTLLFDNFLGRDPFVSVPSAEDSPKPISNSIETSSPHTSLPSNYVAILSALNQDYLEFQVLSPVNITVTAPNGEAISNNFVSIPGAEYMNIAEASGHETATVLIPFPVGGQYTVTATPKPGALPTDTFTILQTQNGVTTTLASNMPIANIPPAGFQTQVKSGTSYSVSFGGSVQQPLTNDGSGHLVATVTVTNQGNVTVDTTQINLAGTTLGTIAARSISSPVSNLAPGASAVFSLSFPSTAVSPTAKSAPLKISGTYSAGTLSGNWTLTFRSVTLPSGGPDL